MGQEHIGLEMAYCGPRGIPLDEFREWAPISYAAALAWQQRQGETCKDCGIHPDVTDPERGGHPDALQLKSWLCRTCEIEETGREARQKSRMPGEHHTWRSTPPPGQPDDP